METIQLSVNWLTTCDISYRGILCCAMLSHTVVANSATPGLQHTRLPCPSLSSGVYSNSCLLMPSNHLIFCCPLLLLPLIFPSIKVFFSPMSQLFAPSGQSIEDSESVLSMNIQCWFPLGSTGLIALLSNVPSRVFFRTTIQKHQFFSILHWIIVYFLFCCFQKAGKRLVLHQRSSDLLTQNYSN